jgi:uncharacterized protein (DUF1697 family)
MPLVVLLRGVNVGGHRTFRPSVLAKDLKRLDVVNVGAAGTFVVRKPISQVELRAELLRRLPFDTEVMICRSSEVIRLTGSDPFAGQLSGPDIVRFVGVLAKRRQTSIPVPLNIPSNGEWAVKLLAQQDRFVIGLYRREMRAIRYLGQIDKIFGVPVTSRNWNTFEAIARVLGQSATRDVS